MREKADGGQMKKVSVWRRQHETTPEKPLCWKLMRSIDMN